MAPVETFTDEERAGMDNPEQVGAVENPEPELEGDYAQPAEWDPADAEAAQEEREAAEEAESAPEEDPEEQPEEDGSQDGSVPDGGTEAQGADEPELVMEGDGQLSIAVGGARPTSSSVHLIGGKIEVEGQFEKGQIIGLMIEARVDTVAFIDSIDSKTGRVSKTERKHTAKIVGLDRA